MNSQADPADPSEDIQTVDQQSLSDFAYAFGQFMDHDMSLTPDGGASFPITVSATDPIGPDALPFTRSLYDPSTGTGVGNPRQQVTDVTAYLDLSQIYGSDAATADALRTHSGGLLKTSPGNMLPYDNSTYFTPQQLAALNAAEGGEQNEGGLSMSALFATGDIRGNENLELTALQTLFVRNHNRLAAEFQKLNPTWTDEQLYQEARKINIAEYQDIVYNEWIPAVLGSQALAPYSGYNPNVNPAIANEFSTVAFRFGHSLLSSAIERQTNQGTDIADASADGSSIPLSEDFFDADLLNPAGVVDPLTGHTSSDIGPILKGDADGDSQATDVMAINDIRNLLFGNYGDGGQDLMARDVQRDRDNGIPDYNTLRSAVGLPRVTSFAQITSNVQVQQELQAAYGSVNNIDAFEGGLAEDHVPGADVGPLFERIMVNQFVRLRSGDRFFYLNESFSPQEQSIFNQDTTLAQVIESNTNVTNLQSDVFFFRASISGTVTAPPPANQPQGSPGGSVGVPGIKVLLEDTSGDVLATTVTDGAGHYSFNQQSGPAGSLDVASGVSAAGDYTVSLVLPTGGKQTSPNPGTITITHGDTNVTGVNFNVTLPPPPKSPPPPPKTPPVVAQMPPAAQPPTSQPPSNPTPPPPPAAQPPIVTHGVMVDSGPGTGGTSGSTSGAKQSPPATTGGPVNTGPLTPGNNAEPLPPPTGSQIGQAPPPPKGSKSG
ncbi:peroxidase family protein [Fimbriiglobus ruber]|uniref:Peroxinectin n=1 Tax=Fimbriiglobus ruber TaxID=1908690 RepID=A0A225E0S7_9BACT|nr:Peroxinectin [Fimbriiglobus ruber]